MAIHKLTAASVKAAGPGKLSDGGGLWIYKSAHSGSWVFRYTIARARREMGFGSYPEISLASARQKAETYRRQRAEGLDPKVERDKEKSSSDCTTVAAIVAEAFEGCCHVWTAPFMQVLND